MLYTIKKSFATHEIKRGKHILYFEEYGSPSGAPVIFLHGGPGSGFSESQKAMFNHSRFRVIFLDQRGSGKSKPYRALFDNNTNFLIEDIEAIRKTLNIKNWLLVGGSWGATLAIAYAQRYPNCVNGIIVRALFLGTKDEVEWAFFKAPKIFKPLLLKQLNEIINNEEDENPIFKLGEMLESKNQNTIGMASALWLDFESKLASINASNSLSNFSGRNYKNINSKNLPNTPFLEWHYIKNNFFLDDNELINNKHIIKKIPLTIIQGEYDLLCPPITSYSFIRGLDNAKIIDVPVAGHYISDPGIKNKMREIIDQFQV